MTNSNSSIVKSGKSRTELAQAIANLIRQNTSGQYNDRIAAYRSELELIEAAQSNVVASLYNPELTPVMAFNNDNRFSLKA